MKRAIAIHSAFAAALLASGSAFADGTSEIEGILDQPIVVTASKTAETESAASGTATVLGSDDLRRYGMHTLQDALDFLSLGVATSTRPTGAEVGARGVLLTGDNSDHVLLLINGHSVNEPLSGGANFDRAAGIPIEIIDHIEVILGPGSVLYGTGAMLAVVNVVTKRAQAFPGIHVIAEASPFTSARLGIGAGYQFTFLGAPSELTASVEYYVQSGPDLAFPFRTFTQGQPSWGGTASHSNTSEVPSALVRFASGNLEINVRGATSRVGDPSSDLWFDNSLNRELQRWGSVDATYRMPVSALLEITTRAYADAAEREKHLIAGPFFGCQSTICDFSRPGVAHWGGLEVRGSFDWLGRGRLVTMLGVDARVRYVAYKSDHIDPITNRPLEVTTSNFTGEDVPVGAYAQQTWQPAKWLAINGGLRIDADPRFPVVLSPRLAATVTPWKGGAIKGIYSEAFRAPSYLETNSSTGVQLPADRGIDNVPGERHLKPERVAMYELSVEQTVGAQRLRFSGFVYQWTDVVGQYTLTVPELMTAVASGALGDMPFDPGLIVSQYRNIESLRNHGFNLGFDGSRFAGALRYAVNATAAITRDGSDQLLTVAPQLFGNARVSYDFGGELPTVALAARAQSRRLINIANTAGFVPLPSTTPVLELRGTVAGRVPLVAALSYRATATYAFHSYEPYAIGQVQSANDGPHPDFFPNRNGSLRAILGLQYDF